MRSTPWLDANWFQAPYGTLWHIDRGRLSPGYDWGADSEVQGLCGFFTFETTMFAPRLFSGVIPRGVACKRCWTKVG